MRKGSIALYLALMLGVMLSLLWAALFSARRAGGRVVLGSAAEQGMFSLFSQYDRDLFDRFGILSLDGGYGGSALRLGSLQEEAEEVVLTVCGSSREVGGSTNLMHLTPERGEVTGYTLLTDGQGAYLKQQIGQVLPEKVGLSLLEYLKERVNAYKKELDSLDEQQESIDTKGIESEYQKLLEGDKGLEEGSSGDLLSCSGTSVGSVPQVMLCTYEETTLPAASGEERQLPETAATVPSENPIEVIRRLQKTGILGLVLPKDRTLSEGRISQDRVSTRELQQGMGIIPPESSDFVDGFLMREYLMQFFTDFTESGDSDSQGLAYQVEYAIGKKNSDRENLKWVLLQILGVRELSNFWYLYHDSVKKQEVDVAAEGICLLLHVPAARPLVAQMLRLCWAFGEGIMDLRVLLQGGKIPLVKDKDSWQLSLENLKELQGEVSEQHSSQGGLDYQMYLRLLLLKESEDSVTDSVMDLMEHEIRKTEGKEFFRLDNCLTGMKICFRAKQEGLFQMEAERYYDYSEQGN
ncbi:MAG: DUF5702 domain-containing protein [Lachnospiraceae bacterium]|nr:DUF5702 domain-containing protein [Lachnospiraceae bacterium]